MANYALIDGYLESMRSSIRWRRDLDDVIAEIDDHLISATERIEARGANRLDAQRRTLDQFGDPKVLAVAFASTPTGGIVTYGPSYWRLCARGARACGSDGVQSGGRARLAVGCDLFDLGEVGDDI